MNICKYQVALSVGGYRISLNLDIRFGWIIDLG